MELDACVTRLIREGRPVETHDAIPGRRQAFVRDPFGRLVNVLMHE